MAKKVYDLTPSSIDELIQDVKDKKQWLAQKRDELARRLAEIGCEEADFGFIFAEYDGQKMNNVRVEARGPGTYAVIAEGETVLFIEFGAGVTYGYGYPPEDLNNMGPGTYPGKGHWDDPNGWWYTGGDGTSVHTYGNPPGMAMYNAVRTLEDRLQEIAQEVFAT